MWRLLLWGCLWGYAWSDSPKGQTAATDISRGKQLVPDPVVNPEVLQDLTALDTAVFAPSLQNATQDTEYQEARPQHVTKSQDINILDHNSRVTKSPNTNSLDTKSLDTKSLGSKPQHTTFPETKSPETKSQKTTFVDTESISTEPQETKSLEKSKITTSQSTKRQGTKFNDAEIQDNKVQDDKLQDIKIQDDKISGIKLQKAKVQDDKLHEIKIQDAKVQDNNLQDTKPLDAKLQDVKLQNAKLQSAKFQTAKLQGAEHQDPKSKDSKPEDDKPLDSTTLGKMDGIPPTTSDPSVPRDITPTGAIFDFGAPQTSSEKMKASEDTLQQGMPTTTTSLMDLLFQKYLASSFQELADPPSGKSQESEASHQSPTYQTKVTPEILDLSPSAKSRSDKPLKEVTQAGDKQSPVGTEVRDKQSPVGTEVRGKQSPVATEVRDKQSPVGTEVRDKQSPVATEVRDKQSPVATEIRDKQTPVATEVQDKQTTVGTEVRDKQTPVATEFRDKQTTPATEFRDKQTTPATEFRDKKTTPATEVRDKQTPVATEFPDKQTPPSTEARDLQTPVATEVRDKRSPMTKEASEHRATGNKVGEKGKVLRVISELDNGHFLEEMESKQSGHHRMAADLLNNFKSGSFQYEFDSGTRNKDLRSRENRVAKPDLGFLTGNRAMITYNKSIKRPQKGHREIKLIIRIRQIINDGFFEDMTALKRFKPPLEKIQNELRFSDDKERDNDVKGGDIMQVNDGPRGRHVFGRHLMSFLESAKTGSADSKQPLTKGEIEALFAKSASDDADETGGSFKTGKESPSSSGVDTFSSRKKAHNNVETSGKDLSEDKKPQSSSEEVTILPSLDNEESHKQLDLPPNLALSPEKDKELDELVDRLQDSYILDFGRKKQPDFKDFEDPDEENDSSEKMIKAPQENHKLAKMFRGGSHEFKMKKRSVEDGSGYYGVSVDDRNDNEVPKEYDVEVDNGVKTERFARSAKHRRIQRRSATKITPNVKNESVVTTEPYREKHPGIPALGHTEHHEHGSSNEASRKMTKVVGVLLIPFPSSHKQEPTHHVPFHPGHHTDLAGAEVHEEHHAGMHHKHPCHYGGHHFGHDDRHPCHHHHHHHHGHHIHMYPHHGRENGEPYPGFGAHHQIHHQIHHHSQGETGHAPPHHGTGRLGEHELHQNPFFRAQSTHNKDHQGGHGSKDLEQITVMTGSHSPHSTRTANGLHVLVILAICFILFTVVLYFIIRSRSGNVRETNSRTALYVPQAKY